MASRAPPPPPQQQQQQQGPLVLVTKQVSSTDGSAVVVTEPHDWSSALMNCCDDCSVCACGCFCYPCLMCRISRRLGEHCCVPMCVPGSGVVLRTKLRLMLGIQGSACNDCLIFCCCCCQCAACQMQREMDTAGWPQS